MPTISIVVPFHNEEENVMEMYDRLHSVMQATGETYELIFVDDGSTDLTYRFLSDIATIDHLVTVVRLGRNFGQTSALAAGFAQTSGKYVIAMDGDLQHDPADIPVFLHKLSEGYDIVSGWRKQRIDNFWLRRFPSRCANWLMAKLSAVDIHDFGTTFKAYRHEVLERLPLYGEMHRFIPALASAYGASICEVPIHNVNRQRGKSHYGISHISCAVRSDDHSVHSAIQSASVAFFWKIRLREHHDRAGRGFLAADREDRLPHQCHWRARRSSGFRCRDDIGWIATARLWPAG